MAGRKRIREHRGHRGDRTVGSRREDGQPKRTKENNQSQWPIKDEQSQWPGKDEQSHENFEPQRPPPSEGMSEKQPSNAN